MANPGETRADRLRAHPRFAEARRAYIEGYLDLYGNDPALNKLLAEASRHVVITFALCLAAAQRDDDPSTWLTLGKLQDVVSAHQVGSPGLVESIVGRMLDRGLLSSNPAPGDARKRILAPTQALLTHDAGLLAAQAAACAVLEPKPALMLAVNRDPSFQIAARVASIAAFGEAMGMLARHPEIMMFMSRDSGYMVLLELLRAELSAAGQPDSFSYQRIGDRYGVSRTHVRDLIADAETAGLVGGMGRRDRIEVLPPLWGLYDRFAAEAMELFDRTCASAYEGLARAAKG